MVRYNKLSKKAISVKIIMNQEIVRNQRCHELGLLQFKDQVQKEDFLKDQGYH